MSNSARIYITWCLYSVIALLIMALVIRAVVKKRLRRIAEQVNASRRAPVSTREPEPSDSVFAHDSEVI